MNELINMKLKVKPVFIQLIHSGAYEGPCRTGSKEMLEPEAERARGKKLFEKFCNLVSKELTAEAEILKPVYMEWKDDWTIPESEFRKLDIDAKETDLFLISELSGLSQYPAIKIAQRYKKPIAMVGQVMNIDIAAYLRARGLEGYAPLDIDELNHLISLLRVRKAVQHTRVLVVTTGEIIPVGVVSNIWNLEDVKKRFGIDFKCISYEEIFEEFDRVIKDENEQRKAKEITSKLIKDAQKVHMKEEYIFDSVSFYIATKNLMRKYNCNAFVIPCFEICAKRIAEEKKVTFCLTHSLLKDEGYPSACEGDINALLAMMLLMYISKKSAYMGNSSIVNKEKNIMRLLHDVPGLKMKGLDKPSLPYEIRNFTFRGWGATLRYDFSRDRGEIVTLARFNPMATELLVTKGEIIGGGGFDEIGCTLRVYIKVKDVLKLFHEEINFGHHLAMVYGDYVQDLKDLGEIMKFKVIEV